MRHRVHAKSVDSFSQPKFDDILHIYICIYVHAFISFHYCSDKHQESNKISQHVNIPSSPLAPWDYCNSSPVVSRGTDESTIARGFYWMSRLSHWTHSSSCLVASCCFLFHSPICNNPRTSSRVLCSLETNNVRPMYDWAQGQEWSGKKENFIRCQENYYYKSRPSLESTTLPDLLLLFTFTPSSLARFTRSSKSRSVPNILSIFLKSEIS